MSHTAYQFYNARQQESRNSVKKRESDFDIVSNLGAKLAKKGTIRKQLEEPNIEHKRKESSEEPSFNIGSFKIIDRITQRIGDLHHSIEEHQKQELTREKSSRRIGPEQ